MPNRQDPSEFVKLLTQSQPRAYVRALVPNPVDAQDVLQQTNALLWEKVDEFRPGSNFNAWAYKVAYMQTLAYRRDRARNRLVLSDAAVERLATDAADAFRDLSEREIALNQCLEELSERQRSLLRRRYEPDGSVQDPADEL